MDFADIIKADLEAAESMRGHATWKMTLQTAVGGAIAAGFERDTETLIVASSSGQGIYDCRSGQRIYRNRSNSGYDPHRLEAVRLDDRSRPPVPMAGIDGGGLRTATSDGWLIDTFQTEWPIAFSVLREPSASILDRHSDAAKLGKHPGYNLIRKSDELPRVFGFSWTGRSLIWMDSSELVVWSR